MFRIFKNKPSLFKKSYAKKSDDINLKNNGGKGFTSFLNKLQELGKALQFPIAVLPFAAILNRFGALGVTSTTDAAGEILAGAGNQIGYWISFIVQQPGAVVFDQLPLLFAIGVAFGLAKDHRGEVALVGAVFYFALIALTSVERSLPSMIYGNTLGFNTFTISEDGTQIIQNKAISSLFYVPVYKSFEIDQKLVDSFNIMFGTNAVAGDTVKMVNGGVYVLNIGVLGGIVAGSMSAWFYNKFKDIQLPQALSFFSGRRFVPMVALAASIPTAFAFAIVWPWIQYTLMKFGSAVADPTNPAVAIPGTAAYAILNRLLLPFGLHQILNTFFWFQLPIQGHVVAPITGIISETEQIVNGDINAFAKGIEGSGLFQGGFFPVMMGGVPAIAIAMIMSAKPENRKQVSGFLGGVAVVSLVSGITEPIEFSFAFISPVLLIVHAILAGIFVGTSTAMQIQIGFGFSAGLIDYIASFAQSWGFAASKTGAFKVTSNPLWVLPLTAIAFGIYFVIFKTVIQKLDLKTPGRETIDLASNEQSNLKKQKITKENKFSIMADEIILAIGEENFVSIDNCTTRLRLILKDNSKIDENAIKKSGAFGIKKLGSESLQIVIGLEVIHVAEEMRKKVKI